MTAENTTYRETVRRFRVMKQLNDFERNPNGDWSLVYSTNDIGDAYEVAEDLRVTWALCGDVFKVVDAGRETWIERSVW